MKKGGGSRWQVPGTTSRRCMQNTDCIWARGTARWTKIPGKSFQMAFLFRTIWGMMDVFTVFFKKMHVYLLI